MHGFEYQAAAHMVWEGLDQPDLLQNGLAMTRAIHDRYNAALRNPYNEIECSDHYSRAMASYGVYQAVCGFNCHGPQGYIEFAPRISRDDFRAAFTSPAGWGTISQARDANSQTNGVKVKHGQLRLKTLAIGAENRVPSQVAVTLDGQDVDVSGFAVVDAMARIELREELLLPAGAEVKVVMS